LIVKEVYGVGNTIDANTELTLSEHQQQLSSWLTHTAASTISANVQKTISYFSMGLPQSITSALSSTPGFNADTSTSKTSPQEIIVSNKKENE
jgi:hypothetical protein